MQAFPFTLENLKGWTVKRLDGTSTHYTVSKEATVSQLPARESSAPAQNKLVGGYSNYCTHTPAEGKHSAVFHRENGDLYLWVANMHGARATRDAFDFVIDGGDVLTLTNNTIFSGDEELVTELSSYSTAQSARVLQIDWDDRQAPLLAPAFWPALNKIIYGDVMTCCIGGHGRSGTTFACLLLVNSPDYDALDAIVHTRAVHCPRAIESVVQHKYIDSVAEFLGRKGNSEMAHSITDYRAAFTASQKPTAERTRIELNWK